VEFREFREIGRRYGADDESIASQWEFLEKHFGTTKLTRADAETLFESMKVLEIPPPGTPSRLSREEEDRRVVEALRKLIDLGGKL